MTQCLFCQKLIWFWQPTRPGNRRVHKRCVTKAISKGGKFITGPQVLGFFDDYEAKIEALANRRLKQRKFMLYGYYKAVAIHIRHMKREFKTSFPTPEE